MWSDAVDAVVRWAGGETSQSEAAHLVRNALRGDTALRLLLHEAGDGEVSARTRARVALALEERGETTPGLADELAEALRGRPLAASGVDVVRPLFFGRDDAEHDMADGLLRAGFLETMAFAEVLSGRKNLVIGRKGSGKSAICMRLTVRDTARWEPCLITPDDAAGAELRRFELAGLTAPAAKALLWRYVFAAHAARHLVQHAKPAHGRAGKQIARLGKFLRANGELSEERLYDRIARAGRALTSSVSLVALGVKVAADAERVPQGVRAGRQLEVLEDAVRQAFADLDCARAGCPLVVLVDQLEQVWSDDPAGSALVIGLLLAGKHVAMAYGGAVRGVLFLRADIYDSLEFGDADKFHSDELRLEWTTAQLEELAATRASAALGRPVTREQLWGEIFPERVGGEPVAHYLMSRVLPRPRDVIQFLNQCRDTAYSHGHRRIEPADVEAATRVFSRWKTLDLAKEYGVRFPFLGPVVSQFRDGTYQWDREELADVLRPLWEPLGAQFPGYADLLRADVMTELLFRVGFLGVARGGEFEYAGPTTAPLGPDEDVFAVHPCFRPALNLSPTGHRQHSYITNVLQGSVNVGNVSFGTAMSGDVSVRPRKPD
ncbi:P-loop ATPase, Sll1717 family [Actinokineospora sp. G85]|uniref:P-loop ATPase, Sll1717 family n=1 Tax=Actinokineospora sp. G85 TaxID=3406626 RepID=UPI003C756AEE